MPKADPNDGPKPRARIGLRPETMLSSIAVVLLVSVLQRSVGFGRAVLFCRWLDADQLGQWEMAYGFLILASPLAVLGLPGSFGRYLERYRQSGRLGLFLRRTTGWTLGLAGGSLALLAWQRPLVAHLVFGSADRVDPVGGVLACLAVVILHHFFEAVFAGLRMFRVVSTMHFVHSMTFAGLSLGLLVWWRQSAASVVLGYAGACVVSLTAVSVWALLRIERSPDAGGAVAHREFWPPLMRFAAWVWITNLLTNVFSVIDRYMIVHCGGFSTEEALVQVGNYHTSTIVPVLLVSVANLVVGAMTPHLSHEWESGRRSAVGAQLNLALKLTTLAMLVAGVAVLWFCPLLFRFAFENKYEGGLAVLPWTLAASVWFSLLLVAQTYVWCAEKSHRAAAPLAVGLVANVLLNLWLLPLWGLAGAVVATAIATLVALLGQLEVNRRTGMPVHGSTLLLAFAPALLATNASAAAIGAVLIVGAAIGGHGLFRVKERAKIAAALEERLGRLAIRRRRHAV